VQQGEVKCGGGVELWRRNRGGWKVEVERVFWDPRLGALPLTGFSEVRDDAAALAGQRDDGRAQN